MHLHYPHIENQFANICNLSILERNLIHCDYPDPACKYILDEHDYIFMTGITFINKTLPLLLEIARSHAIISIVGPPTSMSTVFRDYRVNNLSRFCVTEPEMLRERICCEEGLGIFHGGWMVSVNL